MREGLRRRPRPRGGGSASGSAPPGGPPRTGHAFLDEPRRRGAVLAMAHRGGAPGGAPLAWENTLRAFRSAVDLGYRYLETDVRLTRDGVLLAFHDDRLDRVTDQAGRIADLTAAEVAQARVAGTEPVPLMEELLDALPDVRFNVDLKTRATVDPMVELIARRGLVDRLCVGSFDERTLRLFRSRLAQCGLAVATTCGPAMVAAVKYLPGVLHRGLVSAPVARDPGAVFQVPRRLRGRVTVADARFVARAHALGRHVHAWTVNDRAEMELLLDLGVDGLITDRTDVLKEVLVGRGLWEGQR